MRLRLLFLLGTLIASALVLPTQYARAGYSIKVTIDGSTVTNFPGPLPDNSSFNLAFNMSFPFTNNVDPGTAPYAGSFIVTVTTVANSSVTINFNGSVLAFAPIIAPTPSVVVSVTWTNSAPAFSGNFVNGTLTNTPTAGSSLSSSTTFSPLPGPFTANNTDTVTATLSLVPVFSTPVIVPDANVVFSANYSPAGGGGPSVVPVPPSLAMVLSGLPVGLLALRRRRHRTPSGKMA